jgi:hypothetical protein
VIPPSFTPEFGVKSIVDIPTSFTEDDPNEQWPSFQGLKRATTCTSFLALHKRTDLNFAPPYKQNAEAFGRMSCRCLVLEWLMGSSGARQSFVRDFKLDADSPRVLPGAFATQWKGAAAIEMVRRTGDINHMINYYPHLKTKQESTNRIRVDEDRDSAVHLTFWGLADADGDGLEDVLLYVVNFAREGSATMHRGFAITRDDPAGQFKIVRETE